MSQMDSGSVEAPYPSLTRTSVEVQISGVGPSVAAGRWAIPSRVMSTEGWRLF